MGDHRATIKLEMTIHGKTYRQDMWINYFPDLDGIDGRIVEQFRAWWEDAKARYDAAEFDRTASLREAEDERRERAELARLKAKYEAQP